MIKTILNSLRRFLYGPVHFSYGNYCPFVFAYRSPKCDVILSAWPKKLPFAVLPLGSDLLWASHHGRAVKVVSVEEIDVGTEWHRLKFRFQK